VTLWRYFQQSPILSWTLTLTFRSLSIPESQFSEILRGKAILRSKGNGGLSYSGIDEILLDKDILQIIKPLKMVFCFSCDGVPLKFKKKNGRASNLAAQIISAYY
jgi:hypothetical protein